MNTYIVKGNFILDRRQNNFNISVTTDNPAELLEMVIKHVLEIHKDLKRTDIDITNVWKL